MNTEDDFGKLVQATLGLVGYFDQQVLASYRNDPHKFALETDSFEGTLTLAQNYYRQLEQAGNTDEWLNLKFGYRTLADGNLAIVLWLPDLMKAESHQARWMGFHMPEPTWASPDERFEKWVRRYIGGSWEIDNGPKFQITEVLAEINGLTREMVGHDLYTHAIDSSLTYPAGENTHRYQDAHAKLYGFLIDGLNKTCIEVLAKTQGKPMNFNSDRTLKALERVLPELALPSAFGAAMSLVSEQRRLAGHGVRQPAICLAAFSAFTHDLELCVQGLRELFACLEERLGIDGLSASKRSEARKRLPRILATRHPFASIHEASKLEGKTIKTVEYGDRETIDGVHESEVLVLHFTDGSIMALDTGSNAYNIRSDQPGLNPGDFHVSFHLSWVPPIRKK